MIMDEKEFYIDKDGFRIHAKLAIPGDRTVEKMMQPEIRIRETSDTFNRHLGH